MGKMTFTLTLVFKDYTCSVIKQVDFLLKRNSMWGMAVSMPSATKVELLRVLICSNFNAHTDPLYKNLKLLKVKDIFTITKLKCYHNFIK